MNTPLPISRVVLFKHGLGAFDRAGAVDGDTTVQLRFKAAEISDVLKSIVVLDEGGGHIASLAYDSTEPPERRLSEIGLTFNNIATLATLLPQLRGARATVRPQEGGAVTGRILGLDLATSSAARIEPVEPRIHRLTLATDDGGLATFDVFALRELRIDDPEIRRDLESALAASLAQHRKQARTLTIEARGSGPRRLTVSYTVPTPVWKTSYRLLLGADPEPHHIQGWAVVDNVSEDDWTEVTMSLVAGLPVSFTHDLDTPRYIDRPRVQVPKTTGVAVPEIALAGATLEQPRSDDADLDDEEEDFSDDEDEVLEIHGRSTRRMPVASAAPMMDRLYSPKMMQSTAPAQATGRALDAADFVVYDIQHPVTIPRNQSALVPILFQEFHGRALLLYNPQNHPDHPLRCVEFLNHTGLTLEAGPLTVFHHADYLGEAMLPTITANAEHLIPFAVELKISLQAESDSQPEELLSLIIKNRTLTTRKALRQLTTYTIRSTADSPQTLLLEHPNPGPGWDLIHTPNPVLSTPDILRFELEILPRATLVFPVELQFIAEQSQQILPANLQSLGLARIGKRVDPAARKQLEKAFALADQIAAHTRKSTEINNQRNRIHEEQERLRKNLDSLGDRTSEKALRERYVQSLADQETRLEQLEARAQAESQAQQTASADLESLLASLQLEASF